MTKPTIIRLDHNSAPYEIGEQGSAYIDHLHERLNIARWLAQEVSSLNPDCHTIGPGKLATLIDYAERFLELEPRQ